MTMGTTSRMLFHSLSRYSGDLMRPVTYWLSVTRSGMNLRFTFLDTKPPEVVEKIMP